MPDPTNESVRAEREAQQQLLSELRGAGRATRKNGFISFISGVSMLGIALGVAALIIVLSVMNGFQKEVRDRMLGVLAHIEVFAPGGAALPDLALTLKEAKSSGERAADFLSALLNRFEAIQ